MTPALLWTALAASAQALPHPRGWEAGHASLALYDESGSLSREVGLGSYRQDLGEGLTLEHSVTGGVSSDGRFAWHWHKDRTIRAGIADAVVASTSALAYMGTSGQTLWDSDTADAPAGLPPLLQSADGEHVLLFEREADGWAASGIYFTGSILTEIRGIGRVEKAYLTRNGRFALLLWGGMERPLIYSFLALDKDRRKDIPASEVPLGIDRVEEDGAVRYRKKTLLKLP